MTKLEDVLHLYIGQSFVMKLTNGDGYTARIVFVEMPEEPVESKYSQIAKSAYEKAVEQAIANRMKIVNMDVLYKNAPLLDNLEVGEFYLWSGTFEPEIVCGSTGKDAEGCSACHGDCLYKKRAVRLIAPTEQKDINVTVDRTIVTSYDPEKTVFEAALKSELDKLPYTDGVDDGQYNDGQIDGFEKGAIWANQRMQIEVYYLENEKDSLIQENKKLRDEIQDLKDEMRVQSELNDPE